MSLIEDNISQNVNNFPHRLASLIKEQNLSQADVCKRTGISKQALHHYLSGTRIPRSDTLLTLSELLNVSMKYLLTGESDQSEIDTKGLTDIQIQKVSEYASLFRISNAVNKDLPVSMTDIFQTLSWDTHANFKDNNTSSYCVVSSKPSSGKTLLVSSLRDLRHSLSESISLCPKCKHRIFSSYTFCPHCGKKIVE